MQGTGVIVLVGLLYIVFFGGLSLLRREGLSLRFALESLLITGVAALISLAGYTIHPALFLLILYVLTMRGRILTEAANILAKQGKFDAADRLYAWALRLWPDPSTRHIIHINQATSLIKRGDLDRAIEQLLAVLGDPEYLGVKYEAAAHYNLGIAYLRKEMHARAVVELNAAIDVWPVSEYARYARIVLKKHREE